MPLLLIPILVAAINLGSGAPQAGSSLRQDQRLGVGGFRGLRASLSVCLLSASRHLRHAAQRPGKLHRGGVGALRAGLHADWPALGQVI